MHVPIALDYVIRPGEVEAATYFSQPRQITEFLIRNALIAKYKDGVKDRTVRRVVKNITKALSKAVRDQQDAVELGSHELKAIEEALEVWSVPVDLVDWTDELLESLEGLKEKQAPITPMKEAAGG